MQSEPEELSQAEIDIRKKRMLAFANLISRSEHRLAYTIKLCAYTIGACIEKFADKRYYNFGPHQKWLTEIEAPETTKQRLTEIITEAKVTGIDFAPDTFLTCAIQYLAKEKLELNYVQDVDLAKNICPAWFRSTMYAWSANRSDLDFSYAQAHEWGFLTKEQLTEIRNINE